MNGFKKSGFTLVELMVALIVASIVLAAVATLAHAATVADRITDQTGREQSQLRMVSMRLSDLIRRANGVVLAAEDGFKLWHDANADGLATENELVRVIRGGDGNTLTIGADQSHTQCQNIQFAYDEAAPDTRFITVQFQMAEDGRLRNHSVNARLWASDEHKKF